MRTLIIPEPPLQVLPGLAKELGINEAIVLQQLHYWTLRTKDPDGWVYNTYEGWIEQFPWLSKRTMQRVMQRLEEEGYVQSTQLEKGSDRTKRYRVKYAHPHLAEVAPQDEPSRHQPTSQSGTISSNQSETTHETNQQTLDGTDPVEVVFAKWKELYGGPKVTLTKPRRKRIENRLKDGRTPDELIEALEGAKHDPWLMGEKEDSPGYTGLDTLLRDDDQVVRLQALHRKPRKGRRERSRRFAAERGPDGKPGEERSAW